MLLEEETDQMLRDAKAASQGGETPQWLREWRTTLVDWEDERQVVREFREERGRQRARKERRERDRQRQAEQERDQLERLRSEAAGKKKAADAAHNRMMFAELEAKKKEAKRQWRERQGLPHTCLVCGEPGVRAGRQCPRRLQHKYISPEFFFRKD